MTTTGWRWTKVDALGRRTATYGTSTYTVERSFYQSHGQWKRSYRLRHPSGYVIMTGSLPAVRERLAGLGRPQ